MRKKSGEPRQVLKTVRNALAVLEAFTPDRPELGITDLSRLLGLTKTSVFRLVRTLEAEKYLSSAGGSGRYVLSVRLFELGSVAIGRSGIREAARLSLEELARATQETVHLAILDDNQVVYVDKIDGSQAIMTNTRLGGRGDPHCTATGKALLAFAPAATVTAVLQGGLRRHTPATITDPAAVQQQLELVRRTGYAINRAEWREGVAGVAAPVFDHAGQAVGAVGVAAPAGRATAGQYERWVAAVLQAAAEASRHLGCARRLPDRVEGILEWLPAERPAPVR